MNKSFIRVVLLTVLSASVTVADQSLPIAWKDDCKRYTSNTDVKCTPEREIDRLLANIFALPNVKPNEDISGEVLIAPGDFYDPLWIREYNGRLWLSDDGLEIDDKGSFIASFNKDGSEIVHEVTATRMTANIDHLIVPHEYPGWGEKYGDKIVGVNQPGNGVKGAMFNHEIFIMEPRSNEPIEKLCTLKPNSKGEESSLTQHMIFGPVGTPFEGLYVPLSGNGTIHKIYPDGRCEVFVEGIDGWPMGSLIINNGTEMLLAVKRTKFNWTSETLGAGVILSISPEGEVAEKPVVEGLTMAPAFTYAPKEWGRYAGKLIVVESGDWGSSLESPPAPTQSIGADGKVYAIDKKGNKEIMIENLRNPVGIYFDGKDMYLSDVQGDFMTGREIPDGVIYKFTYKDK